MNNNNNNTAAGPTDKEQQQEKTTNFGGFLKHPLRSVSTNRLFSRNGAAAAASRRGAAAEVQQPRTDVDGGRRPAEHVNFLDRIKNWSGRRQLHSTKRSTDKLHHDVDDRGRSPAGHNSSNSNNNSNSNNSSNYRRTSEAHGRSVGLMSRFIVRPLKRVRDSYVNFMNSLADNPRFDGMVGMGYTPAFGGSDGGDVFRRAYSSRAPSSPDAADPPRVPRSQSAGNAPSLQRTAFPSYSQRRTAAKQVVETIPESPELTPKSDAPRLPF